MTPEQARSLGAFIRQRRLALGLSARELARRAGIADVIRIEQGILSNPRTDSLRAIAQGLDLPLSDLLAAADYVPAKELPTFTPYLRTKYKDLPDEAVAEMEQFLERLRQKHGTGGPVDDEDER